MKSRNLIKFTVIFLFALSTSDLPLFAQESISLKDATAGQGIWMIPDRIVQFGWRPSTDHYTYVGYGGKLMQGLAGEQDTEAILYKTEINEDLLEAGHEEKEQFPFYEWRDENHIQFDHDHTFMVYNVVDKEIVSTITYPEEAGQIDVSFSSLQIAYVLDNDLYIATPGGSKKVAGSYDEDVKYGYHYTHRQEFGIWKGTFWSPTGRYLAFYRADQGKVEDYPLVDYMAGIAEVQPIKYPMAGRVSEEVSLGVYDTETGQLTYMKTGTPADQYLCSVSWGPDEKHIYIALLNRGQNHLKLNRYHVPEGSLDKTLFEEKDDKYVEPLYPLYFYEEEITWASRRDGYWHLYTYSIDGGPVGQLTKGEWEITDIFGQSEDGRYLFFTANRDDMLSRQFYRADLKTKEYRLLTPDKGDHSMHFYTYLGLDYTGNRKKVQSPNGEYLFDSYSSLKWPREEKIVDSKGKTVTKLKRAKDPMEDFKQAEIELFTIKAADGKTDLHCRLYKPMDMEEGEKYPVLLYMYGGPHVSLIRNVWQANGDLWFHYLAERGIGVISVDGRGSAYRGKAFEEAIYRDVGKVPAQDQMQAVEYLKTVGWADMGRLAVHGWSYGGFLSAYLMLNHPGVFKVCVSGAPVLNWEFYEVMYGERYMDTPQQNPEGYKDNNLIEKAGQLDGKLLLIHGGADQTVVLQNSIQFLQACIEEGNAVDFFIYPKENHSIYGMPKVHLYRKITQYLLDNL